MDFKLTHYLNEGRNRVGRVRRVGQWLRRWLIDELVSHVFNFVVNVTVEAIRTLIRLIQRS